MRFCVRLHTTTHTHTIKTITGVNMKEIREEAGTVRFTVTVERGAYDVLERYCDVLGLTKSHVVNAWLVTACDAMGSLMDCIEKAKDGEISLADLERKLQEYEGLLRTAEKIKAE